MAFPRAWLDELLAKNEIVTLISEYVPLQQKGRKFWGLCPIHGEKTASFSVSPDKQLFYCFGCHAGGTAIQFIMDYDHCSFLEAVQFLAQRVGMTLPDYQDDENYQEIRKKRDRLFQVCSASARFYMETLLGEAGGPGRSYLQKRNISSEAIKRFGIGYARDGWSNLKDHLLKEGFSEEELLEAGLLVKSTKSGRTYDAYRNRIIFPIIGTNNKVIAFGARVINDDKPKYINTGDTPIYNKGKNLYGLNLQKTGSKSYLIMVEGYTDVISMYEAGVTNVVASLGTALTEEQAKLLKRFVPCVYIAYDGDSAGQNATLRGLDILSKEGLDIRVISFPDNLDPDEFTRKEGKEGLDRLIENAKSLHSFKLDCLKSNFDLSNLNDREKYAIEACKMIGSLDPIKKASCIKSISDQTGISQEVLENQIAGKNSFSGNISIKDPSANRKHEIAENTGNETKSAMQVAIDTILLCISREPDVSGILLSEEEVFLRFPEEYREFIRQMTDNYQSGNKVEISTLIASHDQEQMQPIIRALNENLSIKDVPRTVRDCIARIKKIQTDSKIEELSKQLSAANTTDSKEQILNQILLLKKKNN